MSTDGPPRRGDRASPVAAADILRRAASLADPARRADAVSDGLGRLCPERADTADVIGRLEDDGCGEAAVPEPSVLLSCARRLEHMEKTRIGIELGAGTDPGRIRSPALRADGPTTATDRRTARRHRPRRR